MSDATPMLFNAVGGHKSSIYLGKSTVDGRRTLLKKTTAWEVMYYLAMEISKDESVSGRCLNNGAAGWRERFIDAVRELNRFTPQMAYIRLPLDFKPVSGTLRELFKRFQVKVNVDIPLWTASPERELLRPLFEEIYSGATELSCYSIIYDTGCWGVGLVDETSGMALPCVLDVKMGYLRHSPLTPAEKMARIMEKEQFNLARQTGMRICGVMRYLPSRDIVAKVSNTNVNAAAVLEEKINPPVCERFEKEFGYGLSSVEQLSTALKLFFETTQPLSNPESCSQLYRTKIPDTVSSTEKKLMEERMAIVQNEVADLLNFFEGSDHGRFLLETMAFLSTSLLVVYDAASSPSATRVRLIDLARCSWRRLNFDEQAIGFLAGLRNFTQYISPGANSS